MTIARLFIGTVVSQILFVLTKLLFINVLNIDSAIFQYGMSFVLALITIAIIRRMGVLNYLESFFTTIVWLVISLVTDLVITTSFTGRDVYKTWYLWISYIVVIVAMIIFHKKIHVETRKLHAAKVAE